MQWVGYYGEGMPAPTPPQRKRWQLWLHPNFDHFCFLGLQNVWGGSVALKSMLHDAMDPRAVRIFIKNEVPSEWYARATRCMHGKGVASIRRLESLGRVVVDPALRGAISGVQLLAPRHNVLPTSSTVLPSLRCIPTWRSQVVPG